MEAARATETSVNFYQTTRRNNPEDSHLHSGFHENLKSHNVQDNCLSTVRFEHGAFKSEWQQTTNEKRKELPATLVFLTSPVQQD
jgi:hypothetical protein